MSYYFDTVETWLYDNNIKLTDEQMSDLEECIHIAASNESIFTGHDVIPDPATSEIKQIEKANASNIEYLEKEYEKLLRDRDSYIRDLQYEIYKMREN